MSEADERPPAGPRGERGAQGNQGNQGERGHLSRLQGRAVVVLFVLAILPGAVGWFWQAHQSDVNTAAQRQEQAAQRRQAAAFEAKLCTTLAEQAANKPPPGSAADNPSRAWEQREHAILTQLGPDVGCKR